MKDTTPVPQTPAVGSAFHDRRIQVAALVLALIKLWFVSAQPINGLPGSIHDDQLFLELAGNILNGDWLGPYSQYTLIKGCGYPVFIALAMLMGLPLPLAEHGLYLLAAWLLVRAIRPLLRNDLWSLALFALIAWQPMSYTIDRTGGNILRQNLYTPLALLVFAGLIAWSTRRASRPWVRAGWAWLLGASLGWLYLTREETIWIVPSAILLALVAVVAILREHRNWIAALWPGALAAATAIAPILLVCSLNARHYGWFGTVEVKAPEFVAAYGALNRVTVAPPRVHYPFPRAARLAVYEVSPSFNALRPLLEGDLGRAWAMGAEDREIHGALWLWALRDAVMHVSQARQASQVLEYYQRIADEVNAACDDGCLPAGPPRHTLIAPWHEGLTQRLKSEVWNYLQTFLLFEGFNARSPRSHGTAEQLKIFRDMTQWHLAPPDQAPELATPMSRAMRVWRIGALQDIGSTLRWICVGAFATGTVCWFWAAAAAVRRRQWPAQSWWIATAALGGALAVWTISFAVHVTGWHDTRPLRFSQGYPLLMLFAVAAAATVFRARGNGSNAPVPHNPSLPLS